MESNWDSRHRLLGPNEPNVGAGAKSVPDGSQTPPDTLAPQQASSLRSDAAEPKPRRSSIGVHGEEGSPPATSGDLARLVLQSRLLDERQLDEWIRTRLKTPCPDSATMAQSLLNDKLLTPYQAQVLARGQTRGLVLGKYEILGLLGEGGMGAVFRARHRRMKREVALKVLPRELVESPEAVQRFHREVQAAAKLHHPNIAAAYDADEEDGIHFLVMELVEGPDLASYVAEAGELPAPVAVHLVIQAARGLAHAHLQGVVHRDIKPANLVVNSQGTLKILDMGLAQLKAAGADDGVELTHMGQAMGTIDYMAPEQAVDARSVDHRADIYSLGCTLYYLLAAHPISPDGSIVQKLLWHQTAPRPSLRDVCTEANERLEMIFQRMVAANPDDRYERMRDVVEDLERVQPELRLGETDLPLIGDDLALYIGMEALAPRSSAQLSGASEEGAPSSPPLHATLPPQKSSLPGLAGAIGASAASVALIEQQLSAAAIMIGKEVAAQTADGHVIRGVVNRLSVETRPGNPPIRAVRLHVGSAEFGLHEIREVFYGNGAE